MNLPPLSLRTACVFALAIAVVNGFGRFAYALLLPVMRDDLAWDYALSAWLNTANSVGYGAGALLGMLLLGRFSAARLFNAGLLLTVLTLAACGFTRDLGMMMVWRFVCGVGSAWVFACGGALIAAKYAAQPAKSGQAIGIYYAGGGLGIAASGALIYPVLNQDWRWAAGWWVLGIAGAVLSLAPAYLARKMDVKPAAAPANAAEPSNAPTLGAYLPLYVPITAAYFLFGVGYIVYLTFVVAWLREMRLGIAAATGVWVFLGFAVMASGYVWRGAMARWWPTHTFAAASVCTAAGTALPLLSNSLPMLCISAALVGGSFFMMPGAMMALTRAVIPAALWAKTMNFFTLVFALGQGIGPIAAGWIGDTWGLNWAMAAGATTLILAGTLALMQPRR